jgi:hypothetical protein
MYPLCLEVDGSVGRIPIVFAGHWKCMENITCAYWLLGVLGKHPLCLLVIECNWKAPILLVNFWECLESTKCA